MGAVNGTPLSLAPAFPQRLLHEYRSVGIISSAGKVLTSQMLASHLHATPSQITDQCRKYAFPKEPPGIFFVLG